MKWVGTGIKFCRSDYKLILNWVVKSFFWIIYLFTEFIYFLFIHLHLFIYSRICLCLNEFCKFYLLWISSQSYLFILHFFHKFNYVSFILIFLCLHLCVCVCVCVYVCRWVDVCVHVCVFLLVFMCMYVLSVTSILAAFNLSLFCLCFSKTIKLIQRYHLLKNPCKRKESLSGILSLERQTSFTCNEKS